jgi:hypothetical protein
MVADDVQQGGRIEQVDGLEVAHVGAERHHGHPRDPVHPVGEDQRAQHDDVAERRVVEVAGAEPAGTTPQPMPKAVPPVKSAFR